MRKFVLLWAMLLPVAVSLTSCHKDGVYNPKEKISRIYYQGSGQSAEKQLSELWNWDGKKLSTITYYYNTGEIEGTEKFSYDGKRLSRIDYISDFGDGSYLLFTYDGRKLDKVEVYARGNLVGTLKYTYDGNKISKMDGTDMYIEEDYDDYAVQTRVKKHSAISRMLRFAVPDAVCETMGKIAETRMTTDTPFRQKSGTFSWTIKMTWDGDNVSKTEYTDDDDYFETIQYSYDKNKNPFYGCYTTGIYDEDYQHEMASKNNVVSEIWDDGDHVEYTYQYDKKNFPTSKTLIYTGEDYTCTWYYEYE